MARGSGCSGQLQGWCTKLVAMSSPSSLSLLVQLDGCLHNLLGLAQHRRSLLAGTLSRHLLPTVVGRLAQKVWCPLRPVRVVVVPLWSPSGKALAFAVPVPEPVLWKVAGRLPERVPLQLCVVPAPCLEWLAPRLGHLFSRTKKMRRVPLGGLVPLELAVGPCL